MRPALALALFTAALHGCQSFTLVEKTDESATDDTDVSAAPDIQVSTALLDFRAVPPGCTSAPQLITVTNVGQATLQLSDVRLAGASRAAYALVQPLKSLAPGESTDVQVTFGPTSLGLYDAAKVVVESNDPDEAQVDVSLAGEGSNDATVDDLFVQNAPAGVDVLVVLDTSSSMEQDIEDLQTHFAVFINRFLALGLDFHLGVLPVDADCPELVGPVIDTTTVDPAGAFVDLLDTNMCDDNETTFDAVTEAFTPPRLTGANAGFLRTDANLAIVVFSDEPEQSGETLNPYAPADFVQFLVSLKGGDKSKVTFSGLVGPETVNDAANCLVRGNPALPSDRYQRAIRQSGGYVGNICNVRVQPFLTLLERTATGLQYSFELSESPTSAATGDFEVTVDGARVTSGWTYSASDNAIVFETDEVPPPGAQVGITYRAVVDGCD